MFILDLKTIKKTIKKIGLGILMALEESRQNS